MFEILEARALVAVALVARVFPPHPSSSPSGLPIEMVVFPPPLHLMPSIVKKKKNVWFFGLAR